MQPHQLWYIVSALLLIAVGLFGKQYFNHQSAAGFAEIQSASHDCNLQSKKCFLRFSDDTEVSLDITPKPISALTPISFNIKTSKDAFSKLSIQVTGVNMDMGNTQFPIPKTAAQQFSGEGILPICTQSTMLWRLRAIFMNPQGQRFVADFPLETTNSVAKP